jgi:putative membrane protein
MISEMLGVNFGLIFGEYSYGQNMGWKILGVPWMIGVNWAVLTYCTAVVTKKLTSSFYGSVTLSSLLMVGIDLLMEVSAPRFDYWEFEGGTAPLQNYIGWFAVALVAQFLFQKVYRTEQNIAAFHILAGITLFFTIFLIF